MHENRERQRLAMQYLSEKNISVAQLAEMFGVSKKNIYQIIKGDRRPAKQIERLSTVIPSFLLPTPGPGPGRPRKDKEASA